MRTPYSVCPITPSLFNQKQFCLYSKCSENRDTHYYVTRFLKLYHQSVHITKFADDTTVTGLVSGSDETEYRAEILELTSWCEENNLLLNSSKTKELIVDFRKKPTPILPITINNEPIELVDSFKFLGTRISNDLGWNENIDSFLTKSP